MSVEVVEQTNEKTEEEVMECNPTDDSGIVDPIIEAVRRLSSAAYDIVAGTQEPESSKTRDISWLELKGGDFAALRDKLQMVMSLGRAGVWTTEERDDLLQKLADGSITNLPESTYAR